MPTQDPYQQAAAQRSYYTGPPPTARSTPQDQAAVDARIAQINALPGISRAERDRMIAETQGNAAGVNSQDEQSYYRWLGGEYGAVRPDTQQVQDRAANLYAPQGREIDRAQVQTQRSIAQRSARSGVKSGYAVGQQQQAWEAAANQRATQREKSIEQAVGLEQQAIAGEAQTRGYQLPLVQQMYSAAQQRQLAAEQASREEEQAFQEFLYGLAGTGARAGVGYLTGGASLAAPQASTGMFRDAGQLAPSGYAYQIPQGR